MEHKSNYDWMLFFSITNGLCWELRPMTSGSLSQKL